MLLIFPWRRGRRLWKPYLPTISSWFWPWSFCLLLSWLLVLVIDFEGICRFLEFVGREGQFAVEQLCLQLGPVVMSHRLWVVPLWLYKRSCICWLWLWLCKKKRCGGPYSSTVFQCCVWLILAKKYSFSSWLSALALGLVQCAVIPGCGPIEFRCRGFCMSVFSCWMIVYFPRRHNICLSVPSLWQYPPESCSRYIGDFRVCVSVCPPKDGTSCCRRGRVSKGATFCRIGKFYYFGIRPCWSRLKWST